MAGHSKWKQIKHKKGAADQKRGQVFGKLLRAISVAGREEPNSQFNPRLRQAIQAARQNNVPMENIERAISRASEEKGLEEIIVEAYGPEGAAILIEAITDNKNRTLQEIKKILSDYEAKMAESGSVRWSFEKSGDLWQAKFLQNISPAAKEKLSNLIAAVRAQDDVQEIFVNVNP